MADHITSWEGIMARDKAHRDAMLKGSNALLTAMFRELAARESRRG